MPALSMTENARTKRARKALMSAGYTLFKSKVQVVRPEYQRGYCIVQNDSHQIAWGPHYELTLDAVEKIITDMATPPESEQQAA